MRQHLINEIKEMLGTLVEEVIDVDSYLEHKSEKELKVIIRKIRINNKKWQESKRRNNGRSR